MKRSYFLKQLIALPFGPYIVQKLITGLDKPEYLLNKFYVAGFQYYAGPQRIGDIQAGESLELVAEPGNKYDTFAVAVFRNDLMIGHVPRSDNKHISRLLQQGAALYCRVSEVNPGKETWEMLKVEVYL